MESCTPLTRAKRTQIRNCRQPTTCSQVNDNLSHYFYITWNVRLSLSFYQQVDADDGERELLNSAPNNNENYVVQI